MKTGIQISSLAPLMQGRQASEAVFSRVRELGCGVVQLQWLDPSLPPQEAAQILRNNGIVSVSVQDFYETVRENFSYYTQLNAATGGTWLCVSRIPDRLKTRQGLDAFAGELSEMEARLTPLGQKLCFHPVTADFTAVPGMDAVAYLLEAMPRLPLCLDLYHLNRNCNDMPGFIRRHGSRICMVHFKDSRDGRLTPAGMGDTDWTGVVDACLEAGVPYGFVEQETWQEDPYWSMSAALDWLNGQLATGGQTP